MRKNAKKILATTMATLLVGSSLVACGGNKSDEVVFWIYGTTEQVNAYLRLTV